MSNKIKIAFIHPSINRPCGPDNSLYELIKRLDLDLYELFLIVPVYSELIKKYEHYCSKILVMSEARQAPPPGAIFHVIKYLIGLAFSILRLRSIFNRLKVNIVHTNLELCWSPGLAARSLGIKSVTHIRGLTALKHNYLSHFISFILNLSSNYFIAVSSDVANLYTKQGVIPNRLFVVNNGVDTHRFRPDKKTSFLHREFGIRLGSPVIAAVGSADPRKGWIYLVRACGILRDKYPNLHCFFIGDTKIGEDFDLGGYSYMDMIRREVKNHSLSDNVHFTGPLTNVDTIYPSLAVYVQPSVTEAGPRAVIEALSSGLPVVASNTGGNHSYIIDGETGYLVPPENEGEIARAVDILLRSKETRDNFSKNARKAAEGQFSIDSHVMAISKIYKLLFNPVEE